MKLPPEIFAEAAAWADAQLSGRSDDERWRLLRDLMESARVENVARCEPLVEFLEQTHEPWRGMSLDEAVRRGKAEFEKAERQDAAERAMQCLRREEVLKRVAPRVTRRRWSRGLDPRTDLDRWIHGERLREAAYPR